MSKKKRNKKYTGPKVPKRPNFFNNYVDCLQYLKKSIYMIARGRKTTIDGKEAINWVTLGTGFIGSPNRFITAAHVINNPEIGDRAIHQDGDKYYLIKHDDEDKWHYRIFEPKLNKEIFVYPDIDVGIIYLDDEFYKVDNNIYCEKDDYIRISADFIPIGSEVGVLGYPLCELNFENGEMLKPRIGNVLLRTDKGVINCRYQTSATDYLYEFTLAFNPGNSGGPIFDIHSGKVVSIVRGYKVINIGHKEIETTEEMKKIFKNYKEDAFIETLNANYSYGFATPTFINIFKEHKIMID